MILIRNVGGDQADFRDGSEQDEGFGARYTTFKIIIAQWSNGRGVVAVAIEGGGRLIQASIRVFAWNAGRARSAWKPFLRPRTR